MAERIPGKKRPRISAARGKLLFALGVMGVLFLVLIARLYYVSVQKGEEYTKKATSQWTRSVSLKAQRGDILDCNGTTLATSYTTYQVCINPQAIDDADRERIAYTLSTILEMDYDNVYAKVCKVKKQQVKLKNQVDKEIVTQLSSQQLGSGVSYYSDVKRDYPEGALLSQVIGFTDIDGNGQTGTELTFNSYLKGVDGKQITETDRDNNPIVGGEEYYVAAEAGGDVELTIDIGMNSILEGILEEAGTVNNAQHVMGVLLDVDTGAIKAVGTWPTYDPNNPPRSDAETLLELSKNRVVTDTYEPGSVFKVITLAAGLDSGQITLENTFKCDGALTVRGEEIHCWKKGGHGGQTLTQAAENSCNCAFMAMALRMGKEALYSYIYGFGLGTTTSSGLMGETSGTVTHIKYVRDADLARIGFGQSISATPMQMAMAVLAAINGGELLQPYYIQRITAKDGTVILENARTVVRRVISEQTSATVRQILTSVVENGSGKNAQIPGYSVGGKTGTSQKYEEDGTVSSTKLIASFVGFVPADDPKYLCLIVVDEPEVPQVYGSTVAAPFVQEVLMNAVSYFGVAPDKDTAAVTVPALIGMTVTDANKALKDLGLTATFVEGEESASVVRQSPAAGTQVVSGSSVILYTSWTTYGGQEETAPAMTKMPDIMGKNRANAYDALLKAGLVMDYDRAACAGVVTGVQYPEGTELAVGTTVTVTFTYTPK